ncbi:MAG: hypothetical protein FJ207_12085 [Gemmatimonadetes bacterium]|nr:hypothetical protein [Gemmatimonadota bacterium]
MRVSTWVVAMGLGLAACGPTEEQLQQLAELPVVTAEKVRLQGEIERLTTEISQIESELANLTMTRTPTSQEATPPSTPATVGQLVAHVSEMEEQLSSAQTRLRSLNATSATQVQRITQLETSIAEERAALEGQRERVSSLEAAIAGLEMEITRQGEVNQHLERTVETMTDDANTVWYVVGTKAELLDRGLIREEGGSRVLFIFGKRGKTIVPSRTMDPSMFTAADQRTLSWIPLPVAEEGGDDEPKWTVVTSQDLGAVGSTLDERGRVLGDALSITDPQRFWANGRYLIVVRS